MMVGEDFLEAREAKRRCEEDILGIGKKGGRGVRER
jgi:hypothetical protein